MTDATQKRSANDAGFEEPDEDRSSKNPRLDSIEALDAAVRVKLRSMFEDGLVKEEEIDEKALQHLEDMDREKALDALDQYSKCDLSKVRKKSAYLIGVIQRMKKTEGGWGNRSAGFPNGSMPAMAMEVSSRLQMMFQDGVCQQTDLDNRCIEQLAKLPVAIALEAINQFSSRDLSDVRNYSALFVSIVRKVQRDFESRGGAPPGQMQAMQGMPGVPIMDGNPMAQFQLPGQMQMPVGIITPMGLPQRPVTIGVGVGNPPSNGTAYDPLQPSAMNGPLVAANMMAPGTQASSLSGFLDGKRNYGMEQLQMGVRVDEFHRLSVFATFVHPAPALKLQQLWDEGVRLVSLLDDGAWEALASLKAAEGLTVVEEVVTNMKGPNNLRNVNAFFMSVARRYLPGGPSHDRRDPATMNRRIVRVVRQSPKGVVGDLGSLSPELRQKIEDVLRVHMKHIRRTDFDQGVVEALKRLPELDASGVIDDLGAQNLTNVNNMPAFIMSIIRRRQRMAMPS